MSDKTVTVTLNTNEQRYLRGIECAYSRPESITGRCRAALLAQHPPEDEERAEPGPGLYVSEAAGVVLRRRWSRLGSADSWGVFPSDGSVTHWHDWSYVRDTYPDLAPLEIGGGQRADGEPYDTAWLEPSLNDRLSALEAKADNPLYAVTVAPSAPLPPAVAEVLRCARAWDVLTPEDNADVVCTALHTSLDALDAATRGERHGQ